MYTTPYQQWLSSGYYSSHYAQAYIGSTLPASNVQNFTQRETQRQDTTLCNASWYRPGNSRCSYPSCSFSGSFKSVEIHMMDRHLIYPPDWEKRQKKPEWDADPSLKGKMIPIQGTTLTLDTPEALEAWIAERKRRWPTADRVQEKKRRLDEAIAQGQLPAPEESGSRGGKRRKAGQRRDHNRHRHWSKPANAPPEKNELKHVNAARAPLPGKSDPSSDSECDGAPEELSTKGPDVPQVPEESVPQVRETERPDKTIKAREKKPERRPKQGPRNPFASRPSLLRNLLLPEIRMTVSNLSQAIRFLVDNDFLRDVETKPGEAQERLIEVVPP